MMSRTADQVFHMDQISAPDSRYLRQAVQGPHSQQHPRSWPSPASCLPASQRPSDITLKRLSQKHHLCS